MRIPTWRRWTVLAAAPLIVSLVVACEGRREMEDDYPAGRTDSAPAVATPAPGTDTPIGAPPAPGTAIPDPDGITPAMVTMGEEIFTGKLAGGTCQSCHGANAKGGQLGPNLTDSKWINTDGTYNGIIEVVTKGVAQPKEFKGVMPPMGGARLSDDQVKAVSAYVYSLSHKTAGAKTGGTPDTTH